MKTITLPTGIEITTDSNGNIINCYSPYVRSYKLSNMTILRYYVKQIKQLIK